jgi:hypothetical protein
MIRPTPFLSNSPTATGWENQLFIRSIWGKFGKSQTYRPNSSYFVEMPALKVISGILCRNKTSRTLKKSFDCRLDFRVIRQGPAEFQNVIRLLEGCIAVRDGRNNNYPALPKRIQKRQAIFFGKLRRGVPQRRK